MVIIAEEKSVPLKNITHNQVIANELSTKKNSYNFIKKEEPNPNKPYKNQKDEIFSENTTNENSKVKSFERGKRMKVNGSNALKSKSEKNLKKGLNSKKKSLQSIHANSKSKSKSKSSYQERQSK